MIIDQLKELEFKKVGTIALDGEMPAIQLENATDQAVTTSGCVYSWVLETSSPGVDGNPKPAQIVYIGQSSRSFAHRRRDWHGGFAHHKGKGRAAVISNLLKEAHLEGKTLSIWVRCSARHEFAGHEVSLSRAEEQALIRKFNPVWNKAA